MQYNLILGKQNILEQLQMLVMTVDRFFSPVRSWFYGINSIGNILHVSFSPHLWLVWSQVGCRCVTGLGGPSLRSRCRLPLRYKSFLSFIWHHSLFFSVSAPASPRKRLALIYKPFSLAKFRNIENLTPISAFILVIFGRTFKYWQVLNSWSIFFPLHRSERACALSGWWAWKSGLWAAEGLAGSPRLCSAQADVVPRSSWSQMGIPCREPAGSVVSGRGFPNYPWEGNPAQGSVWGPGLMGSDAGSRHWSSRQAR